MSNTATLVDIVPAQQGGFVTLNEYEIALGTATTDLDVMTPSQTTNRIWVCGIWLSEGTALNLTFKSIDPVTTNVSKTHTLELAANQQLMGLVQNGFYFVTKPGEKLTVQASQPIATALGVNFVLQLGESPTFRRII